MGMSFSRKFCFFGPGRTGTHSIESSLRERLSDDYLLFEDQALIDRFGAIQPNEYFEYNGNHTRATMLYRRIPEAEQFRSAASFREPFSRIESLYCHTAALSGVPISQQAFEQWVELVFLNAYHPIYRSHRLQTDLFYDDAGRICVDRIFATSKSKELLGYLLDEDPVALPNRHINRSSHNVSVTLLTSNVMDALVQSIARDLTFWNKLQATNGIWVQNRYPAA